MSRRMPHILLALSLIAIVIISLSDKIFGYTAADKTVQHGTELYMGKANLISKSGAANKSEPGAGESIPCETCKHANVKALPLGWTAYVDRIYGFRIGCPKGFVVRQQNISTLAQFTPTPVASIFFMNPTMASGALAMIEPPDLEVRVYKAGKGYSLKSWLVSVGFASIDSGANMQPYRNANVSGMKVCQSTMILPGCSIYVLRNGRIYQLTAISIEGESMIETFKPLR